MKYYPAMKRNGILITYNNMNEFKKMLNQKLQRAAITVYSTFLLLTDMKYMLLVQVQADTEILST